MPSVLFNIPSMITQSQLRLHNKALERANERLATGSAVNSSKDNPAKNYEAKNLESDIRTNERAKLNAHEGAALLQIAEGTCNEVQSILQRIRELSIQSANDTLTSTERKYLDNEASSLLKEVDRITASTTYNKKILFGNKGDSFSGEQRDLIDWNPFSIERDEDGEEVRAGVLHIGRGNLTRADEVKITIPELSAKSLGLDTLCLSYQGGATAAIDDLDSAMNALSAVRTYMGSFVNRMDNQVEDLSSVKITLSDNLTKIKDTDFAKEATALTMAQIQQQAAISILAQGNSRVSRVLEILGG